MAEPGAGTGERDALAAVGRVLGAVTGADFELQPILDRIATEAAALCRAETAHVFLLDGDHFNFVAASGGTAEHRDFERAHPDPIDSGSVNGRVAITGHAVQIADLAADADYRGSGYTVGGYRTLLGVPIRSDGELIGTFGLGRKTVLPFSDAEIELVSLFADQAAIAIRVARLLTETHEALERETAVGEVLQTISRSTFDLQQVLQTVIDSATRLSHADEGNIVREEKGHFRMAAYTEGVPARFREIIDQLTFQPGRGTITGRVLMERGPVQIEDILADAEYTNPEAQEASGFRTVLAVPLLREGTPIGVLIVWRLEVRRFSDAEVALMQTFADQAAIAIANVRLFETVERQRTELARFAPQVAGLLTSAEGEQLLAGHRREISAMFCDLRGFTAFAETAEPEELLSVLRSYHAAVGEASVAEGGTVEHFAGDGLMVFFNDPAPIADHQLAAVRTACAVRDRFTELAAAWRKRGYELGMGIGIASGYATLGRIGFEGRYDYGAMGIVVNLASRLSDAAEGGQILISQRHYAAVDEAVEAVERPAVTLKGFGRPVPVWAVEGVHPSA
jgi:class 3 adenylate cyclase